jgi:manganese/iron transport system permease protein/iron/zinc/copper transport system permease protein
VNFYVAAGVWGAAAAVLINRVAARRKIGADAAIGIVTTASFALGVALISKVANFTRNFEAALFGNVLAVQGLDLLVLTGAALLTGAVVFLRYRQLLFATFDPEVAQVHGVPLRRMELLFSLVLAVSVIATLQILGATLIAATIVIPAIVARLLTDSFPRMLGLATATGALTGLVGMYVSYYADVASGATIVLTGSALFLVVYTVQQARGRVVGRLGRAVVPTPTGGAAAP